MAIDTELKSLSVIDFDIGGEPIPNGQADLNESLNLLGLYAYQEVSDGVNIAKRIARIDSIVTSWY